MAECIYKNKTTHEMWQNLYELEEKLEKEHGLDICERHNVQSGFEAGLEAVVNMPTIDIVTCNECKHIDRTICLTSFPEKYGCKLGNGAHRLDFFCSCGERNEL